MQGAKSLILIVEDNPHLLALLTECLCDEFSVATACTARDGILAAHQVNPDLILCDLNMHGGSGLHLFRALRTEARFAHLPIMLMSGDNPPDECGLWSIPFVSKPFTTDQLIAMVKKHLPLPQPHAAAA